MKDRDLENNQNAFRDQISTVTDEGKRVWIYPKKPSGRFWIFGGGSDPLMLSL